MYASLAPKVRTYLVYLETLLKDHILPYFSSQTMTASEIEKHYKVTNMGKQTETILRVSVHFGFSSWNLRLTDEVTTPFSTFLGPLFGNDLLFLRIYGIFRALIFLVVSETEPHPDLNTDSDLKEVLLETEDHRYGWTNHSLEGRRCGN